MTAPYQGQDLPLPIQRAIGRLMDPELPVALSAAERVALAVLLRRVEARNGTHEFWVRRCNLAATFDCVERTITNWLAALERKGLIVKEQGRTRWGNFKSLTLQLSDRAVALFGLDGRTQPKLSTAKGNFFAGGHNKEDYLEQSPSERHSASPDLLKADQVSSRVPADCAPLLSMGMTAPGVFKLMAKARKHGKRLGDVVNARHDQLAAARNPFALACALLADQTDYAAVARLEAAKRQDDQVQEAHRRELADAQERLIGAEVALDESHKAFVRRGYVEVAALCAGSWRLVGSLAGEGLSKFWAGVLQGRLDVAQGRAGPPEYRPA